MSADPSRLLTERDAERRLHELIGKIAHRHGLVNSADPECSPTQWCLRCEIERAARAALVARDADLATVRGTLRQWREQRVARDAELAGLRGLLKEAWEFPEYPGPGEGLVSTEDDHAGQEQWRVDWNALDERVQTQLGVARGDDSAGEPNGE